MIVIGGTTTNIQSNSNLQVPSILIFCSEAMQRINNYTKSIDRTANLTMLSIIEAPFDLRHELYQWSVVE